MTIDNNTEIKQSLNKIDLITLLDNYHTHHTNANNDLKSCFWNIHKARRQKGGFHMTSGNYAYTALNVRESLRAKSLLQCNKSNQSNSSLEPKLSDESLHDDDNDEDDYVKCNDDLTNESNNSSIDEMDTFQLHLDGIPPTSSMINKSLNTEQLVKNDNGLRRRNNNSNIPKESSNDPTSKTSSSSSSSPWSKEYHVDTTDSEEETLSKMDPIYLFGALPPADLKHAQSNAREALMAYVQAANFAAAILNTIIADSKE